MDEREKRRHVLERWREALRPIHPELVDETDWANDEAPSHLLHWFRPDGANLDTIFNTVKDSAPVVSRLKEAVNLYNRSGAVRPMSVQ